MFSFHRYRPFLALGLFTSLSPLSAFAASPALLASAEVLKTMEHVADWQLNNPCAVDFFWKGSATGEVAQIRIGWDGTVLRKRTVKEVALDSSSSMPTGWTSLIRAERHSVAFTTLPAVVQAVWRKETGLDPSAISRIDLMDDGSSRGWEMAALYHGLLALGRVSERPVYRDALRALGQTDHWFLGERIYHADDHAVGYMYLDFYAAEKKASMIADVQARFDWILHHPSKQEINIAKGQERWSWCDALFMAPPVWLKLATITGDKSYLQFMDHEWWLTTHALYSPEDKLYFRDASFLDRREPNGQKIFWSRGNGWVLASLALMLEDMPKDFLARPRYVRLLQDMAARIASLQPEDGLWRSSLLDTQGNPGVEESSSAFFCYAFARGVRLGLLEADKYSPIVAKTWAALQRCVNADGRVGFIQQPGAAPGSADADSTAPYGVGAYLLAGSEVYQLARAQETHKP